MLCFFFFFFFKQKTAYEMRISDWSSDVCSSDLGTNTYLDLVGEHTAYSVFPEALSTSQNVRFGFVLDYDALVAKVGLAANGHMHWVAIEKIGRASCRERVCQYV